MFRGRIKITGEIADFNTLKNKNGETMVQKDGSLSFFRPEEVENVEQSGWQPASELPPVDENGNSQDLIVICGTMNLHCDLPRWSSVVGGVWGDKDVKWWCYPPKCYPPKED